MYISNIHIRNYRCFKDHTLEFQEGLNIIIGENNSGKSALLNSLRVLFGDRSRTHLTKHDFYQGIDDYSKAPEITVTLTLRSTGNSEPLDDKALVATWLTKLDEPWEATLTYRYFLPEKDAEEFVMRLGDNSNAPRYWSTLEQYLGRYIAVVYAGNPDAKIKAEPEWLNKFDCQFVDSIRDAEAELFSGKKQLLKSMLTQVLDADLDPNDSNYGIDRQKRHEHFHTHSEPLQKNIIERLEIEKLFKLTEDTGAEDGGKPKLSGNIEEDDIIAALKLYVSQETGYDLPVNYNGLGYNNLIYISLILASLDYKADVRRRGQNASLFPLLLIEEPEAHLHPALQYKFLKYVKKRLKQQHRCRQLFLTSHSTHITAASGLDPLVCMSVNNGEITVSYPAKTFCNNKEGEKSKKYVERYLDATKSNMLFSKGVIFVEGLSEQLLLPILGPYVGCDLEDKHIAVISVGGSTFKHFLPLFGNSAHSIKRRVSCLVDADPSRKEKEKAKAKYKKCWPYLIGNDGEKYEYKETSDVIQALKCTSKVMPNVEIMTNKKTFEYDLAFHNPCSSLLIPESHSYKDKLKEFMEKPKEPNSFLEDKLEDGSDAIQQMKEQGREKARFASYYLLCVEKQKGACAFEFGSMLSENYEKSERDTFSVPRCIQDAIQWACGLDITRKT